MGVILSWKKFNLIIEIGNLRKSSKTYFAQRGVIFQGFVVKMMPRCPAGWDYDHIPIQSQRTHVCMRFLISLLTFYSIIFEASTELCWSAFVIYYYLPWTGKVQDLHQRQQWSKALPPAACCLSLMPGILYLISRFRFTIIEQSKLNLESRTFKTRQSVA